MPTINRDGPTFLVADFHYRRHRVGEQVEGEQPDRQDNK